MTLDLAEIAYQKLLAENEQLKSQIARDCEGCEWIDSTRRLQSDNAKLIGALEYYADVNNHIGRCDETGRMVKAPTIPIEIGYLARQVLAEIGDNK